MEKNCQYNPVRKSEVEIKRKTTLWTLSKIMYIFSSKEKKKQK